MIKKSIPDFTLVFFHTTSYPYTIIQDACQSRWCHIAMALKLDDEDLETIKRAHGNGFPAYGSDDEREGSKRERKSKSKSKRSSVYLLESTTDDYPCAITGSTAVGVKVCLMEDRLSNYPPDYVGLKMPIVKTSRDKEKAKRFVIEELVPEVLGRPYEKCLLNLVKAWVHWLSPRGCCFFPFSDPTSMFCTEVLAHVLTRLSVLDAYHPPRYAFDEEGQRTGAGGEEEEEEEYYCGDGRKMKRSRGERRWIPTRFVPTDRRGDESQRSSVTQSSCISPLEFCPCLGFRTAGPMYERYTDEDLIIVDFDNIESLIRDDRWMRYGNTFLMRRKENGIWT